MRANIPLELRQLPQWVCADSNKVPIDPKTLTPASVIDSSTWGTFEQAVNAGLKHVGIVLTTNDDYTIIDLDVPQTPEQAARHLKIIEAFPSYTEISQSGKGLHIIVRGEIPTGVHRDKVEVYSSGRYMICTGNVYHDAPITNCQKMLDTLYGEIKPASVTVLKEHEEIQSDQAIMNMAMTAANAAKFNTLCAGDWQSLGYESQSEADHALLTILAFYSPSNEQVRRIFRMSALGKRDKAKRDDYLNFTIRKIRAQEPPPVDLSTFNLFAAKEIATSQDCIPISICNPAQENSIAKGLRFPPGLLGDIATYIYETSFVPIPEVALSAAITFFAGICGRSFNTSTGQGLNQYIVLLALAGSGKEGALAGVDRLISAIRQQVPMIDQFIGPTRFASGQALIRALDANPCFVSFQDEFGKTLQRLNSPKANATDLILKQALLDIYGKSGHERMLRPTAYSDVERNTKLIQSPNVTILGLSTPEDFFESLDESNIKEGLIPRLLIIEHTGDLPYPNRGPKVSPSKDLVQNLANFAAICIATSNKNTCITVSCTEEVNLKVTAYERELFDWRNANKESAFGLLRQRLCEQATRLATLVAVGVNPQSPVVTMLEFEWALQLVEQSFNTIASRFEKGEVGCGDGAKAEAAIRSAITAFLEMAPDKRETYKTPKAFLHGNIIPQSYLYAKLKRVQPFKTSMRFMEDCLKILLEAEVLQQIPATQIRSQFGSGTKAYVIGPCW